MSFSNVLKDLMSEHSVSQTKLANAIGFSQRAVSKWISAQAEPSETAIVACAKFFGVTVDEMLGITEISAVAIPAGPISESERTLVEGFRSLPEAKREQMIAYLDFLKTL